MINNKVVIEGATYYKKTVDEIENNSELLSEYLAQKINLNVAYYESELMKTHNIYSNFYTAYSKDLNSLGKFTLASEVYTSKQMFTYIYDILKKIKTTYSNSYEMIFKDIIKMYFFDVMIFNADRIQKNYGFVTNKEETKLYLFDHDKAFILRGIPAITFRNNNIIKEVNLQKDYEKFIYDESLTDYEFINYYIRNFHEEMVNFQKVIPIKYHYIMYEVLRTLNPNLIKKEYKNYFFKQINQNIEEIQNKIYDDIIKRGRYS